MKTVYTVFCLNDGKHGYILVISSEMTHKTGQMSVLAVSTYSAPKGSKIARPTSITLGRYILWVRETNF